MNSERLAIISHNMQAPTATAGHSAALVRLSLLHLATCMVKGKVHKVGCGGVRSQFHGERGPREVE